MKSRFNLVVLVVLVAMCMGGWTALGRRQSATPIQWEYTVKTVALTTELSTILNEYGLAGWELIQVNGNFAIFKRQRR